MATATITWRDGELQLRDDDNELIEAIDWPEPITASSDSLVLASQFGEWDSVDHDGETIVVARIPE